MNAPGQVLVTGGEHLSALDRLAAVCRWADGVVCAHLERSQAREAAERRRERAARQRALQRADRRRALLSTVTRRWWR